MSEEKNVNLENEQPSEINFEDSNEPIESIEKTVADLKKKIQELADLDEAPEGEEELDIPEFVQEEPKEEAPAEEAPAEEAPAEEEPAEEPEEVQDTVAYIKENAVKAFDDAKAKISELAAAPKVKEVSDKTAETFKNASAAVKEKFDSIASAPKVKEVSEKTNEAFKHLSGSIKDTFDGAKKSEAGVKATETLKEAGAKISEGTKNLVKSADEFVNKPEVQEKIAKAKTGIALFAGKAKDAITGLFKKEEAAEEAAEEITEAVEEEVKAEEAAETVEKE